MINAVHFVRDKDHAVNVIPTACAGIGGCARFSQKLPPALRPFAIGPVMVTSATKEALSVQLMVLAQAGLLVAVAWLQACDCGRG